MSPKLGAEISPAELLYEDHMLRIKSTLCDDCYNKM
jgi:hypothetical protein